MATPRITGGWRVTTSNQIIDFMCDEAGHTGDPFTATLRLGVYTAKQFADEVQRAIRAAHNGVGDAFTCVWTMSTRKFTIDNGSRSLTLRFDLNTSTNAAGLLGFADATTGSASGHTSTDTVGNEGANPYFLNAGVFSWAPTDPAISNSPVTAAADGSAAALLQRIVRADQQATDGGMRETIVRSVDKIFRVTFGKLSAAEQTRMERLLDWIQTGAPINYQPDASSENALRLVLANPAEIANAFWVLTRSEVDYPELVFIETLERT